MIDQMYNISTFIVKVKSLSCVRLFATPWTIAYQAPQSMEFSRQEYWSGLPFPSPGDLPDPGIEPGSPTLWADALLSEPPGKPLSSSRNLQTEWTSNVWNLDNWTLWNRFLCYPSQWQWLAVNQINYGTSQVNIPITHRNQSGAGLNIFHCGKEINSLL